MRYFDISRLWPSGLLKSSIVAIMLLGTGVSAEASEQLWTVRNFNGKVVFDSFPFGPASGNDMNHSLEMVPGQPAYTQNFLGFQFAGDGGLWAARDLNGKVVFDHYPMGPASGNDASYLLQMVPGEPTLTEDFLGFQIMDDGSLWTARDFNGRVIFDSFPFGPSSGNDMNYPLEMVPGEPSYTEDFLGFQFLDDGSLWTARDFDGRVIFDSFPFGPASGNDTNYPLEMVPGEPTYTEDFLGFQFLDDGSLWTARDFNGRVIFDSFPFGPSSGNDTNYPLEMIPGQPTLTADFLGFQFLTSPLAPGVPEPGTWALMIAGFAGIGLAMRRSRGRQPVNRLALRRA